MSTIVATSHEVLLSSMIGRSKKTVREEVKSKRKYFLVRLHLRMSYTIPVPKGKQGHSEARHSCRRASDLMGGIALGT